MIIESTKKVRLLMESGLSTADIQEALGLRAQETIRRYQRGESHPNVENAAKLDALCVERGITTEPTDENPFE